MMNKKSIGFLKFEWKKIILPIILIILFSYEVYVFYSIGNVMNEYSCDIADYINDAVKYREQNNTEMLKKIFLESRSLAEKLQRDIIKASGSETVLHIVMKINPFFPVACEIFSQNYCKNYISKKSFYCANLQSRSVSAPMLFNPKIQKYNPISIWLITLHFILLFVIGYLVSAVILWIFRNIKIKNK